MITLGYSCNNIKDRKIETDKQNILNSLNQYDSIKYYKDADWVTFDGIGEASKQPFDKYPYISINYKVDTIDIFVFYSNVKKSKLQLRKFGYEKLYYYATVDYERDYGQNMIDCFIIDKKNKTKIHFYGRQKDNAVHNTDIQELEYYTKEGDEYLIDIYKSSLDKKATWKEIIKKDEKYLKNIFCDNNFYKEKFEYPILYSTYSKISSHCSDIISNEIDSSKSELTNPLLEYPTIFYFKASSGNAFKDVK